MDKTILETPFSLTRVYLLIRNLVFKDLPGICIGIGAILGINLVAVFFAGSSFFNHARDATWWVAVIAGAMIMASLAFKEMNSGKTGTDWLLLPATSLEKYAAAFVTYVILVPCFLTLDAVAASALLHGVERIAGGIGGSIFNPLVRVPYQAVASFLAAMLVLLAGSARFRKLAFVKTWAVIAGYSVVVSVFVTVLFWLLGSLGLFGNAADFRSFGLFSNPGNGGETAFFGLKFENGGDSLPGSISKFMDTGCQIVFLWGTAIAAFFYGIATVKEKEARDAVQ